MTFWALGEMVRRRADILESEDALSSQAKLSTATHEYVSDASERRWIEPALAHLLGLESSPPSEREELFAAWRTFFERVSERGPTVLVFEDLQWADPGLIDFIEHCLEWARNRPILIVTLARPELLDHRPTWGAGQRSFMAVHLEPLAEELMRKLLSGTAEGLPDFLVDQIVERAEGVPLYAVEMLRMLVDRGHLVSEGGSFRLAAAPESLEIPATLRSLIASRLDGLSDDDRRLLQVASVLGKTFTIPALAAVTGEPVEDLEARLRLLVRKELLGVETDPRSPERGQFGFVQALIREVAYQTLSRRDRQHRHAAAARHFESLVDDELASVVAVHYLDARRAAPEGAEADELAGRARDWLVRAAERAASLGAHRQALGHISDALSVTPGREQKVDLWERAARFAQGAGEVSVAEHYLEEMIEWGEQVGDGAVVARAKALLGNVLVGRGQIEPALDMLRDALSAFPELETDPALVRLAERLAAAHMLRGDYADAIRWSDRVLVAAERLDLTNLIAGALITKGVAVHDSGRWRESAVLLSGVTALCEEHGLVTEQVRALLNTSYALSVVDPSRALAAAKQGLDLARKLGLREYEGTCAANGAENAISTGDWDWAEATFEAVYGEDLPDVDRASLLSSNAAHVGLRGDRAGTHEKLGQARALVESMTSPQHLAGFSWSESLVALAEGRLEDAFELGASGADADPSGGYATHARTVGARAALWMKDAARAALMLQGLNDLRLNTPLLTCTRVTIEAGIAALHDRRDEAISLYRRAIAGWHELHAAFLLALAQLDFVTLVPDGADTGSAASEARATFERLGATPFLERLDRALE